MLRADTEILNSVSASAHKISQVTNGFGKVIIPKVETVGVLSYTYSLSLPPPIVIHS